ncbi:hypothetical protein [Tunturiibacter gelidiferens]|uniref:Uncharacterized protein n=1 Tax=Tunturiibacter gelidiferens TaxID=3069689 RepID=A0AAU7Z3M9_9BACT
MMTDPKIRQFSQIESIAALSTTHYAVAAHQEQGENIIVSTTDGGESWIPTHIVNTFAGTLLPHEGEYWAFGIEYLGREHDPSGGYSAPWYCILETGRYGNMASVPVLNLTGAQCKDVTCDMGCSKTSTGSPRKFGHCRKIQR